MATAFQERKYDIAGSSHLCHACQVEIPCSSHYFSAVFLATEGFERRDYCETCWRDTAIETGGTFAFWKSRRPPLAAAEPKKMHFDAALVMEFFRKLCSDDAPATADASETEDFAPASPEAESIATESSEAQGAESDGDGTLGQDGAPEGDETKGAAEGATPPEPQPAGSAGNERDDLAFVIALLLIRKKMLVLDSTLERDGCEWLKVTEKREPKASFHVKNPNLQAEQLERVKLRLGELLHMHI